MAAQEQIAEAMNAMQRQNAELASQLAEERHRSANIDSSTGVGQVDDASSEIGGYERNWTHEKRDIFS